MRTLSKLPLTHQILATMVASLTVIFLIDFAIVYYNSSHEALKETEKALNDQLVLITGQLESTYQAAREHTERSLTLLHNSLPGPITPGEGTARTGEIELPVLKTAGGETVNANHVLLENFKRMTGDEAAVFLVKDGKLYRAATLLRKDGRPMDGTVIDAQDPVAQAVTKGNSYVGLTFRGGKYQFSNVKPLKDQSGAVFAALSVRVTLDSELEHIRGMFGTVRSGKTGYVFILQPTGDDRIGEFIFHPSLQGKNAREAMPAASHPTMRRMISEAEGVAYYDDADGQGGGLKQKILSFKRAHGWNWAVGMGSFVDEYTESSWRRFLVLLAVGALAGVINVLILYPLIRSRLKPLEGVIGELDRVAAGDLTAVPDQADGQSRNEIDRLSRALAKTIDATRQMIAKVARTASTLGAAADQLDGNSRRVLERSQEQASASAKISATVEQFSVSVEQVAGHARSAASISEEAGTATRSGEATVRQSAAKMEELAREVRESAGQIRHLGDQSKEISGVISVIREIAEQTNLLALNAAIEAARAGEHGRGFAVVADEVRKLAERTNQSSQQIARTAELILGETEEAVQLMATADTHVTQGVAQAKQVETALQEIQAKAAGAVAVITEIATATQEQSAASQQMAQNIERMARTTEENVALVSDMAQHAESLRGMAHDLEHQIAAFRI